MRISDRVAVAKAIRQQLRAFTDLGYLSSWSENGPGWNISTANGGVYHDLTLEEVRLLVAGLAIGAQGRETSAHLSRYDYNVLYTALSKEETLMTDLTGQESYAEEVLASVSRLQGYFGNQRGFE